MHLVLPHLSPDPKIVVLSHTRLFSASLSGAFGGEHALFQCCYPNVAGHSLTPPPIPGLLASAILKMDGIGGLAGWRWIFVSTSLSWARAMPESWPITPQASRTRSTLAGVKRSPCSNLLIHHLIAYLFIDPRRHRYCHQCSHRGLLPTRVPAERLFPYRRRKRVRRWVFYCHGLLSLADRIDRHQSNAS